MNFLDRVKFASESRPENGNHAYRVLIARGHGIFCGYRVATVRYRDVFGFYIPVFAELLPDDLHVCSQNKVRPVRRLALHRALLAPGPFHCQPAQHDGLTGTNR
jgi:hypothetical protein